MYLNGLDKLLARLYLKIRPGQREKLVTCARLPRAVESSVCHSTIKYLKCVRKRSRSIEQFLKTLTEYFKTLDDSHDLLYLLDSFHRVYPRLEELEGEPEVVVSRCTASEDQKTAFTCLLVRMSNEFSDDNLEILVALSPTPEGKKDSLTSGVKLFAELQCHGCITEENIDLLDDLFRVLKLAKLMELLEQYRETYRVSKSSAGELERHQSFESGLPQPLYPSPQASSNSLPQSSNSLPQSSSRLPQSSSRLPQSSSQLPQSSSRLPQHSHSQHSHPPTQPHPSSRYSSALQESSTNVKSVNPTQRTVRPIDSHNTSTPTAADQQPFPSTYGVSSPPLSQNGSMRGHLQPKGATRSLHPPPVSEVRATAPPQSHALKYNSNLDSFTPANSEELFLQPVSVNSGPIVPSVNSTGGSYTPANSGELFPHAVSVNSGLIASSANSVYNRRIVPNAAAKGTLSAEKFPSKKLNKTPTNDNFKTAASTDLQIISERTTLESYEHMSNFPLAEKRQFTGDLAEMVVGREADSKMTNQNGIGTTAVPREEQASTVSMEQVLALINQEEPPIKQPSSSVFTVPRLNGNEEFRSVNVAATPFNPQQYSGEDEEYQSPPSPEVTTVPRNESSSPVGEETNRRFRKRSGEDLLEEMAGPAKRRQPAREAATKSMFASVASSVKNLFGYK